ncbi:MAG: cysteine peptidase family C39 domain-containing protein, partial [Verrucomicrobiota bacterium]
MRNFFVLAALLLLVTPAIKGADGPPTPEIPPITLIVPPVGPVPQTPVFSENPKSEDFFRVRVFQEPLIPVGEPTLAENKALASALITFAAREVKDNFSALTDFLHEHPNSAWGPSLLTALGLEYYNTGYFSRALEVWTTAWNSSKHLKERRVRAFADRALGELIRMHARIGNFVEIEGLLAESKDRSLPGGASEQIAGAKQALWAMRNTPEVAFRCGPLALKTILSQFNPEGADDSAIQAYASTQRGVSLGQVCELSKQVKLHLQIARREPNAPFLIPAVVHWKVGHYAAVLKEEPGGNRFLVVDPTFGNSVLMSATALEAESSGYFLVRPGPLPRGWIPVSEAEANTIWGKGTTTGSDPNNTAPYDQKAKDNCPSYGMPVDNAHLMLVSLNIEDTPVRFSPPRGPSIQFTLTYNQREANQPANFAYSHFGQKWTHNWLGYIVDNGGTGIADVQHYVEGGGTETFTGFDTGTQTFVINWRTHASLKRDSSTNYTLTLPDGSKKVYGQPDGTVGAGRKVFLTQVIDPTGYALNLAYTTNSRLVYVIDPQLQRTNLTFAYASGSNPGEDIYLIRRVTDYYGRYADFTFSTLDTQLSSITDIGGLRSDLSYGVGSFIQKLTTPYGDTKFFYGEEGRVRWLETLDAEGGRTRVEFNESPSLGIPNSDPGTTVPVNPMLTRNSVLYARNTYYWDKKAMHDAPGDYSKARVFHWLHTPDLTGAIGTLESFKEPFENRVWYNYPGQTNSASATQQGTSSLPIRIGRVLDDGTSQFYALSRNQLGKITNAVDPSGRSFSFIYASNGIDLLEVRQTLLGNELLASASYNSMHLPVTFTNTAGQVTRYGYNQYGQLTAVTNALNQIILLNYGTSGHLLSVDGPLAGTNDSVSFSYDAYDRIRTITDPDGFAVTTDYDVFDRPLTNSFPDGTKEIFTYNKLDPNTFTDRGNRVTTLAFNSLRQLVRLEQATNWITYFDWCNCGYLEGITDPRGVSVFWRYDTQSRPISKEFLDGSSVKIEYEQTTSRIKAITTERAVIKTYSYFPDNNLKQITYSDGTPTVSLTYGSTFNRLFTIQDGTGTSTNLYWSIDSPPSLGAG